MQQQEWTASKIWEGIQGLIILFVIGWLIYLFAFSDVGESRDMVLSKTECQQYGALTGVSMELRREGKTETEVQRYVFETGMALTDRQKDIASIAVRNVFETPVLPPTKEELEEQAITQCLKNFNH